MMGGLAAHLVPGRLARGVVPDATQQGLDLVPVGIGMIDADRACHLGEDHLVAGVVVHRCGKAGGGCAG